MTYPTWIQRSASEIESEEGQRSYTLHGVPSQWVPDFKIYAWSGQWFVTASFGAHGQSAQVTGPYGNLEDAKASCVRQGTKKFNENTNGKPGGRDVHHCIQCKQPFHMWQLKPWSSGEAAPARSGSIHYMDPEGLFCKLRCAAAWAVALATAHAELRKSTTELQRSIDHASSTNSKRSVQRPDRGAGG